MKTRKFEPPFLIQMTSGDNNKHCDVLPHGSIHEVKKCEEGHLWLTNKVADTVPPRFAYETISEKPEVKNCPHCKNEFPKDWKFIMNYKAGEVETCIRCFEKHYIVCREEYREALRDELKLEMKSHG